MNITATDLRAFPLSSDSFSSLEEFALVAHRYVPEQTILEVDFGDGEVLPVIDMDLSNALRATLVREFV
jgi:hypothetical protein